MRTKLCLLVAALGLIGCAQKSAPPVAEKGATPAPAAAPATPVNPGDDPKAVALLRRSMDVYGQLQTFQATGEKTVGTDKVGWTLTYSRPNRYKLVVSSAPDSVMTTVSDGSSAIEYDSKSGLAPRLQSAPGKIGEVSSMQMTHPYYGGTMLYQFFGGSADYDRLVDSSQGPVTLGPEETDAGEKAQVVKFTSKLTYGHIQIAIGEKTGYVYRIVCDDEPLKKVLSDPQTLAQIQKSIGSARSDGSGLAAAALVAVAKTGQFGTTQTFSSVTVPKDVPEATFACQAPPNTTPVNVDEGSGQQQPPVPIGKPAPDFAVKGIDGKSIKLADLKGHPVLLDFWATWCGPCVASLPHTQAVFSKGKATGLKVLAISSEELPPVSEFIKKNGYTFPTAIDKGGQTLDSYNARMIPTTVVIDKDGNLAAYIVGGGQDEAIESALVKVGVKL